MIRKIKKEIDNVSGRMSIKIVYFLNKQDFVALD